MVDFRVQVSENGTRPSRFLADCNGVAADRNKSSRISGIVPGVGRRYAYRRRISLPFGIHIDRLSPMLRLARAVEGTNSCLVRKGHVISARVDLFCQIATSPFWASYAAMSA